VEVCNSFPKWGRRDQKRKFVFADNKILLMMMILKMNESTKAPKPKRSGPYMYFGPMSIGGVICKAMVDSGNLWKNVLSLDFLHQLGLTRDDLREVPRIQEVGTAKSGTGLKVLGELKTPTHLRFGGFATWFKCRPVVLRA
jgi:hypothetical protein